MKPTLIFIAPIWTPELEELLTITRESFSIKVLTQRQNLEFNDSYIEILQCFESYSPMELAKLVPWLLQLPQAQFHVVLTPKANHRQLAGVGALTSMIRAFPQCYITHSPWPSGSWSFPIWRKAFQTLFDGPMPTNGRRALTLPKIKPSPDTLATIKTIELFRQLWVFPSWHGLELDWKNLIQCLLNRRENLLEFWNWECLTIRQQNKIRSRFTQVWDQFRSHTPRIQFEDWAGVQYLILVGSQDLIFSETDLLDLVYLYDLNIIMDSPTRRKLQGPWRDGDTFWLWHSSLADNENRPWNNPYVYLPLTSKPDLKNFRDQISNQVLRSFIKLDFQRQEY
jgi:hypothetical protein